MLPCVSIKTTETKRLNSISSGFKKLSKTNPGTVTRSLSFLCWNARSLNNKTDGTMIFMANNNIDIAFVTETWLSDRNNVTTSAIKAHGFDIIHSFRTDQRGGGTAIIFRVVHRVSPVNLDVPAPTVCFSYSAASFISVNSEKLLLLCLYRTGPVSKSFFDEFNTVLSSAMLVSDRIVIAGDFNIHVEKSTDPHVTRLLEIAESFGFSQLVKSPTHIGGGCIDLIFDNSQFVDKKSVKTYPAYVASDHFPVTFNSSPISIKTKMTKEIAYRDYKDPAVMDDICTNLKTCVPELTLCSTFQDSVSTFFNCCTFSSFQLN